MKYISHLDLLRLFGRASRRAGIPLILSKGFSPRPKISLKRALKLGLESEAEEGTFQVAAPMTAENFRTRLQAQLPEGITINNIEVIT
jgi:radical SAM-linked protein